VVLPETDGFPPAQLTVAHAAQPADERRTHHPGKKFPTSCRGEFRRMGSATFRYDLAAKVSSTGVRCQVGSRPQRERDIAVQSE
jgi:hypothetical protein